MPFQSSLKFRHDQKFPRLSSCPSAPYYKDVRRFRYLVLLTLLPLALATGCDRGAAPRQAGKLAPDFTVSDGTTTVHLANYRGQVVLVNFWATWCEPCLVELPSLLQLHHAQPKLVIVGVSIDEDGDAYTQFLSRRRIDFTTVRDPNQSVPKLFNTSMWPETYVIDRQGFIRRKFVGAQDWTSTEIQAYLQSL
jgi:cytochrome c biogenesis protein CcmG, thiol:disulfide interchange protein DsbE